ncbi:MAG TPA: CoB--CoM heterodisulfide reductase iron-sulfur subunit A family protein [Anaerolineae bacterium]|nr:CoB--CoM heterodisulfide reductase iron-sulfur subunit A family protein [Anaerolineae bacterium]
MPKTRVGVFVCHCGNNIGGVVRVPEVVEYARTLPNVVHAEDNLYTCSEEGLSSIRERIADQALNRVVVASCTPRTHEPLFQGACEEAGLNKYLFEFVNIREHCSWVHMHDPAGATEKAKELVRMGVAKACYLEPQEEFESGVFPATLVIGGGVAGMTAALALANQGIQVHLVERERELGGLLRGVRTLFPTEQDTAEVVAPLVAQAASHPQIALHLNSAVESVAGFIGDFEVAIRRDGEVEEFKVGTVIVATGAEELKPAGLYRYSQLPNVVTQLEFEERFKAGADVPDSVVMINCAGARIPERTYCGRFCCTTAIKNAIWLKEQRPDTSVYVLFRDVMAYGVDIEKFYRRAMELGVRFVRYDIDNPPEVVGGDRAEAVKVQHQLMGKEVLLPADLVVLTTPLVAGEDNEKLSKMLKVPLGGDGFFLEAHLKLRPIEFATDGVYVCGSARYPSNIPESVSQAYATAAKAAIPIREGLVRVSAIDAVCDERSCSACGNCVEVCPFGAIELRDGRFGRTAYVNPAQCKGCGNCVAACPSGAMQQKGFNDRQLLCMIGALAEEMTGGVG